MKHPARITQNQPDDSQGAIVAIKFSENDSDDPYNWSKKRKLFVSGVYCLAMTNSTLSSSLPAGTIPYIRQNFSITDSIRSSLVSTAFLLGYLVGPLICAPMSEQYGRRLVILISFGLFTIASICCAVAPSFGVLIVFRLIAGIGGGTPISLIGGVYADIFRTPRLRGTATAIYTVVTTIGTTLGPTIFAFVAIENWRWSFCLTSILAAVTLVLLALVPETLASIILRRKARQMRKSLQDTTSMPYAPIELDDTKLSKILKTTLSRPMVMLFTEPIVFLSTIYVSLVFALLFLLFQAYPYIFQGIYGMSVSHSFLGFIPMGVGTVFALPICMWYDHVLYKAKEQGKAWANKEEFQRLPLACFAGPLLSVSLLWLAWSSRASVHWIVPMLAGLPFGIAANLIFIAYFNYLTDAYSTFSASALAAASCGRSIWGALLPLATARMYETLGVTWATSLLGFVSLAMIPIPFIFIHYGDYIRANSNFCKKMAIRTS